MHQTHLAPFFAMKLLAVSFHPIIGVLSNLTHWPPVAIILSLSLQPVASWEATVPSVRLNNDHGQIFPPSPPSHFCATPSMFPPTRSVEKNLRWRKHLPFPSPCRENGCENACFSPLCRQQSDVIGPPGGLTRRRDSCGGSYTCLRARAFEITFVIAPSSAKATVVLGQPVQKMKRKRLTCFLKNLRRTNAIVNVDRQEATGKT